MSELRLTPAALLVWVVLLSVAVEVPLIGVLCICFAAACAQGLRHPGQALLLFALGSCALVLGSVRADQDPGLSYTGTVIAEPTATKSGGWYVQVSVPGVSAPQAVFPRELEQVVRGSTVRVDGNTVESMAPPRGFSHTIAAHFRRNVEARTGPESHGLLPAMVLGDTAGQSEEERRVYIATGLSHLSVVSGANISLVTSTAFMLLRWAGCSPRWQVAGAVAVLLGFVALVGLGPSVLRAGMTGLVSLAAVAGSTRMQPAHALSLGVIALLLWRSDLAAQFGFALSVAATAGIVGCYPFIYSALARLGWPDVLTRAVAVAIAADVMTMPIVALMTGEVSLISVLANVLVEPATAPIRVLGVAAIAIPQLLYVLEPCAWWIYHVAYGAAALPVTTVRASPQAVLVGYGWVMVALYYLRTRV
ncbi:ComEC/Rec2 family competence protein [Corynebacterium lizhenjunii]|uniref:ComEC/Rec2 family competence protein n=1 Tax=Corynebacterium lizhenjunii TaxID=2709394 RepID=A0A7T0P9D4_9CORY|nr:ComEC/Rec2 family competence protein [Corynebacterium lizhenjunii]QPK78643.1 ComEC/Rec2 family competence protein [Corynebacterium lizhenjunii]